jgi:tetratricopeptide (TPR) repeat protein
VRQQQNQEIKVKMKTFILAVLVLGLAAGAGLIWLTSRNPGKTHSEPAHSAGLTQPTGGLANPAVAPARHATATQSTSQALLERRASVPPPAQSLARTAAALSINSKFESLLDPQVAFERKQEVWAELTKSGKLDVAIAELELRAKENPSNADIPASLGRGYLQKAGSIEDVREQGILGMKADQTFEAALGIDAQNWEARFWKATAMSHWPMQLNKTPEVVDDLLTLVDQQEKAPIRSEFAQTYVLLGEQYDKSGHPDYAKQIWQRGLALFPDQSSLKDKLAKQP